MQLESRIDAYQSEVSQYFSTLPTAQYQRIAASRKAMGSSGVSLEFLKGEYAKRIYSDTRYALDTESLIQYNGGGNRPKESYNYAAIIQA
jgi:hypothetical protein